MNNLPLYAFLVLSITFIGCEGNSPIRIRSSAASTDGAREEILAMSQFDLDQCKVDLGSAGSALAPVPQSSAGGSSASSPSESSNWNDALDKSAQLFGDDEPANNPQSAPAVNSRAPSAPQERVTNIRVLNREDLNFARVDVSSNTARLHTRGTAMVTKQVPTRRGGFQASVDSAEVNLVYNLINGSRGWLCSSVQAEVIESFEALDTPSGSRRDFGNRIGW